MNNEAFEASIIDTEKNKKHKAFKIKAGTIHAIVIGILALIVRLGVFEMLIPNLDTRIVVGYSTFVLFLFLSIAMILLVYVKTPFKGTLRFHEDHILLKLGKEVTEINLVNLENITFNIINSNYSINFKHYGELKSFKIDIIFQTEKEELNNIIEIWKQNGHDVKIIEQFVYCEND